MKKFKHFQDKPTFKTLIEATISHLEPNCIVITDFVVLETIYTFNKIVTDLLNYNCTLLYKTYFIK